MAYLIFLFTSYDLPHEIVLSFLLLWHNLNISLMLLIVNLDIFTCLCMFFGLYQIPATLAPIEALEAYTQISSHPFHKTNKQGIISLDILHSKVLHLISICWISKYLKSQCFFNWKANGYWLRIVSFRGWQDLIATGGIDTNAVIFDRPSGQILATLSGHSKKVLF